MRSSDVGGNGPPLVSELVCLHFVCLKVLFYVSLYLSFFLFVCIFNFGILSRWICRSILKCIES